LRPFLVDVPEVAPDAAEKHLTTEIRPILLATAAALAAAATFDAAGVESTIRSVAQQAGLKAAPLIHAIRVALTGRTVSAGLFDVIVLLGPETTVARLRRAAALGG
jgi:glutamyl-tRNA synthetase